MTVSSSTNKVSYNGDGSTTVFAYSFKVFDQDDLTVILRASDGTETTQTLTTNYSVSGVGDAGGGNVTMVTAPASGQILTIVREQPLTQGLDLVPNDPFPAQSLEESLDKLTFIDQRLSENIDRALSFSVGDIVDSATLPVKEDRIGRVLGFNATTGNPEAGPEIADVSTLSAITADISTLADIEDGTDATDAIQTVAGISGNVTTVAGISSDVTTVAGITGNIASVVADEADIGVVAGISGDVSTVSAISTDVTTVAADGTDIGVVAGISSDVTTVSGISTDVTTVSSISSNVTTVAGNSASITTVAGNSSNVTIVADNIADVTTVASNIGSITTKVSKSGDTMTGNLLFDDTSKVLLGTRSNLQIYHSATAIAASNITLYFTNGSTSGTMEITDTDHTISVSDTVRVDSPEILNSTPVTVSGVVLSSLQQDLIVSATTATTFTVPVTYASDPGTTGTLSQAGTYYYYTGSATSYISEQGAGSLHVLGSEINVYNADETSQLAQFSTVATKLFHDNSEKLTTTATGISLPEDLTVQGNLTVQGTTITVDSATAQSIDLGDGDRMRFGDSNDAYIEWNGTYFDLRSTGRFDLLSSGNDLRLSTATNVGLIVNHTGGTPAVQLYNSGVERLATTSTGIAVTGNATFGDNDKAIFGAGSDLQIYHDGSNSYIDDAGTGNLTIRANQINFDKYTGEAMARFRADGNTELFYDNAAKLATTSTGVDITGTLTSDGLTVEDADGATIRIQSSDTSVDGGSLGQLEFYSNDASTGGTGVKGKIQVSDNGSSGQNYEMNFFTGYVTGGATAETKKMSIGPYGDISFYDTSGNAKLTWDASAESLGVGTTTPSKEVSIKASGNQVGISIENTKTTNDDNYVIASVDASSGAHLGSSGDELQIINTHDGSPDVTGFAMLANDDVVLAPNSGNVLVGTTSSAISGNQTGIGTSSIFKVAGSVGDIGISDTGNQITFSRNSSNYISAFGGASASIRYGAQGAHIFTVAADGTTEAMRIDSSGNLLVGKTSGPNYNIVGIDLTYLGEGQFTTDNRAVLQINRQTSDGDLAVFRKDGTTVGSIGVQSTDQLYIGTPDGSGVGIVFDGDNRKIDPTNGTGSNLDNAVDLGNGSHRFKDLFLSGGVYLGGTGSANKLDDYEEGTWTPTFTNLGTVTLSYARYTKIGNSCTMWVVFSCTSTPTLNSSRFTMPFTSNAVSSGTFTRTTSEGGFIEPQASSENCYFSSTASTSSGTFICTATFQTT